MASEQVSVWIDERRFHITEGGILLGLWTKTWVLFLEHPRPQIFGRNHPVFMKIDVVLVRFLLRANFGQLLCLAVRDANGDLGDSLFQRGIDHAMYIRVRNALLVKNIRA